MNFFSLRRTIGKLDGNTFGEEISPQPALNDIVNVKLLLLGENQGKQWNWAEKVLRA